MQAEAPDTAQSKRKH